VILSLTERRDIVAVDVEPIVNILGYQQLKKDVCPLNVGVAVKKLAIAVAVFTLLTVLALVALAVLRAMGPRELILIKNGLALADLRGNIIPYGVAGSPLVPTSTDHIGRLDLSNLPSGSENIRVTLRDARGTVVLNSTFTLPTSGSRTYYLWDRRTICTTERTFADFGLFKLTTRDSYVMDFDEAREQSKTESHEKE
jgi:hypothetical protein